MSESQSPTPTEEGDEHSAAVESWVFYDEAPTADQVRELLATLPATYGVLPVDFIDFVQALPQTVRTTVMQAGRKVEQRRESWTLYMSVAGRIAMMQRAAELNGWRVDYEPEPVTPTGIPGYLRFDDRVVYREYAVIHELWHEGASLTSKEPQKFRNEQPVALGRKPGTAWVPQSGGRQAAGSNPYEKVETSARGRAIAAWGIGILPGSGVASLEEMQGASQNRAAAEAVQQAEAQIEQEGTSREDLVSTARSLSAQFMQERELDPEQFQAGLIVRAREMGVKQEVMEGGVLDWEHPKLKDGQVQVLINQLRDWLRPASQRQTKFGGGASEGSETDGSS